MRWWFTERLRSTSSVFSLEYADYIFVVLGDTLLNKGLVIRASIGTLAVLGLASIRMDAQPTTAYLLQHGENGCFAYCGFCPQSRSSRGRRDYLSRILWPIVELDVVVDRLRARKVFRRICIQSIVKPWFHVELVEIAKALYPLGIPVSISTNIVPKSILVEYHRHSDMLGIGLDAASPRVFREVLRPGTWESYWRFIREALEVYGKGNVYVHLIVGLGEEPRELLEVMEKVYSMGGSVSLFAFTPIRGTLLEDRRPPALKYYRLAQVVNYLLSRGYRLNEIIEWSKPLPKVRRGPWLNENMLEALLTSGCPYCNRPYYNERPGKVLYNYPDKRLIKEYRDYLWRQILDLIA